MMGGVTLERHAVVASSRYETTKSTTIHEEHQVFIEGGNTEHRQSDKTESPTL